MSSKDKYNLPQYYQKMKDNKFGYLLPPASVYSLFKCTPLSLLMFTLLLNFNVLISLKNSLVTTFIGAELISFIRLFCEMPITILFFIIYIKFYQFMNTERAFRIVIIFLLCFYFVFVFVIFPNQEFFHPDSEKIQNYVVLFPHFKWFIMLWAKWSFVLMYVMVDLWFLILFSVLFFQLAKKLSQLEGGTKFYIFFSVLGQSHCLVAGIIIIYFSSNAHFLVPLFEYLEDPSSIMLQSNIVVILFLGIISLYLHKYIEETIIAEDSNTNANNKNQEYLKISIIDSLKAMTKSKYLVQIAILIVAYNCAFCLVERLWLYKLGKTFPHTDDFMIYQGKVLFWEGVVLIFFTLVCSLIVQKLGWIFSTILTPIMMLISGVLFFSLVDFEQKITFLANLFYIKPMLIIVSVGAIQNIIGKSLGASFFAATKEMAYLAFNEQNIKARVITDILSNKIGIALASLMQVLAFCIFPSFDYDQIVIFLVSIFIITCAVWIYNILKLSKLYHTKITTKSRKISLKK